jgi:muconolactone D-isomerase
MEFFVTMTTEVPEGTSEGAVEDTQTREAAHSRELAAQGRLLRLWRPPVQPGVPFRRWMTVETTPLSPHPNDPPLITS